MKISLNWLSDFIDISSVEIDVLVEKLTMSGLEVEGVEKSEPVCNVVTAKVIQREKHPNADKLSYCKVFDGDNEYDVVCGASNVAEGQIIPFAKVGAILPGNFVIKAAKLRGIDSFGMICSAKELGLEEKSDGIMVLPVDTPLGEDVGKLFNLGDTVLDVSITPNRADCLSVVGIAREIAAVLNLKFYNKTFNIIESEEDASRYSDVEVLNSDFCPIYLGRIIKGVTIKNSPIWMQNRLRSVGVRPINNVVDVTNYIMFEYGQPLHSFDLRHIDEKIVVRNAHNNETIVTLDGKDRNLNDKMLVIADKSKCIGIAGIMGGEYSGIDNETKDVFLECAYFKPENIRMTARRLGMQTDSSYRFERGIDIGNNENMADYAAYLIQLTAGGSILRGKLSNHYTPAVSKNIVVSYDKIRDFVGFNPSDDVIDDILKRLNFGINKSDGLIEIKAPSYRVDIDRWQDIAEEVARLFGYENIEATVPKISADSKTSNPLIKRINLTKDYFSSIGFNEVINYSFIDEEFLSMFDKKSNFVRLKNPISSDLGIMRTFIFPSILKNVVSNYSNGFRNMKFFEISNTFIPVENELLPLQNQSLSFCITGNYYPLSWAVKDSVDLYFYIKGVLESLFGKFKLNFYLNRSNADFLHPGKSADIFLSDGEYVGFIGELHPTITDKLDINENVCVAELLLSNISSKIDHLTNKYRKFSSYPFVYKDLSIVISKDVNAYDVMSFIEKYSPLIESVYLYDVYSGERIDSGKISMTFRIYYLSLEKTLTDEETNKILEDIIQQLDIRFNATLR